VLRAELLKNLGRPDEALATIEKARKAGVDDADLLVIAFQAKLNQGKRRDAMAILGEINESVPSEAPQWVLAKVAREGGIRNAEHANRIAKIARASSKSYLFQAVNQFWARQASVTRSAADFDRALEASGEAARLAPSDPGLLYEHSANLYHQWLSGGRDRNVATQLLSLLRQAREIRPESRYWVYVGKSLITMLEQPQVALPELQEAVRRADIEGEVGGRVHARSWLGVAYLLLHDETRAEQTWREAIELAPKHPNTWKFADSLDRASADLRERMLRDAPPQVRALLQNRRPR
jgi:tetratricopeptide (TPR) repeat protein